MTAPLKKPSIPGTNMLDPAIAAFINPLKENIEILTGIRRGSQVLTQLPASAQLADCIATINQIIMQLNVRGT